MEKLRRELDYLRLQDHGTMIVNSPKMKNVIQTVNAIAPTDSNVVILGESGTGKDMMARYIHERSNRSREAFISINCAALPEQLLESELFGYEAGALEIFERGHSAGPRISVLPALYQRAKSVFLKQPPVEPSSLMK